VELLREISAVHLQRCAVFHPAWPLNLAVRSRRLGPASIRPLSRPSRFNLSKVGEHFINPCCFGEDLAEWLRIKLIERSVEVRQPYQEDWAGNFRRFREATDTISA
jgi:hypothetical protein